MAKSVVAFELRADGNQAEGSVKSLKAQLREAQADVQALSDKFGATSQEAIKAAQRAAELKDAIGDAKALTDAFNPDRKFQAFSGAIQGVVGGFAALQGAQALFGSESEELEKVLVKVQAAMALSQGINSIMEAKDAFNILGTVIKTNVVGAFSSMKAAIASTGIGLLIIGVGLLVEKFMSMSDAAEEAAKSQEKLNESTKRFADIGLKANLAALERQQKLEIARAKNAGKTEQEIFNIQQDFINRRKGIYEAYNKELGNSNADAAIETENIIKNLNNDIEVAELEHQTNLNKARSDAAKERNAKRQQEAKETAGANKAQNELQKKLQDEIYLANIEDERKRAEEKLRIDLENAKADIDQTNATTKEKNESKALLEQQYLVNLRQMQDKYAEEDIAKIQENATKQAEENNKKRQRAYEIEQQRIADEKAAAEERIKIAEAETQSKIQLAQSVGNALGQLSSLVGEQTAVGKGLALAQIAIDTGLAISALTKNSQANPANAVTGGIAGAVQFATGIAQIIANIAKAKQILSTANVPARGGGGGATPSVSAPLTPQLQVQQTQLNQGQINQLASATTRAFVLESDVSGNQERIRRINRAARIN